jgi:hypothetical protein
MPQKSGKSAMPTTEAVRKKTSLRRGATTLWLAQNEISIETDMQTAMIAQAQTIRVIPLEFSATT